MSKYIIDTNKYYLHEFDGALIVMMHEGKPVSVYESKDNLEELNSDYINEHYGELQDEAYKRGYEEGCKVGIKDGMCDAWEAARKIVVDTDNGGIALSTLGEIFGTQAYSCIMRDNTAQEAIAKLKSYEGNKDEPIKAGDLVELYIDGKLDSKGIYLQEDGGYWRCLFYTGAIFMTFAYPKWQFKKTGRHFDIEGILGQLGNERHKS